VRFTAGALCFCAAALTGPLTAAAAEMSLLPTFDMGVLDAFFPPRTPRSGRAPLVFGVNIAGEIMPDDGQRFEEFAQKITSDPKYDPKHDLVTVMLSGPGGNLVAGLRIGEAIHNRGWSTAVDANSTCESACGFIWIAGVTRGASKTSHIGFHAAYNVSTRRETGVGNAVLGSYFTKMGLSYDAIAYLTTAGPAQMTYLSAEAAAKYDIAIDGELPSQASLPPPQTARKVIGRPYVDGNGNYIIPADILPYIGVSPETVIAHPPDYQRGVATVQLMFRGAGRAVTTGPDGSVIIPAEAVVTHYPRCGGACAYEAMDVWMKLELEEIHQIESGVLPPQVPETTRAASPPPCSIERLQLARRYGYGIRSPEMQLHALELCPLEMCPYLGPGLMRHPGMDWAMAAARLCPQL
jgi:hypothetical protein